MPENQVTVFLYEEELNYLKWLVLQKPNIETGGDLFGLWQNENTVVVQLLLGPGKNCSRTTTSFHQDVDYLNNVGNILTTSQGLCNIGEWHSHHRIDLAEPSGGDQTTVWNHIKSIGVKFLVFIANITGQANNPVVNVGCFLFNNATREMQQGTIECLQGSSPLRLTLDTANINTEAEKSQDWITFQNQVHLREREGCFKCRCGVGVDDSESCECSHGICRSSCWPRFLSPIRRFMRWLCCLLFHVCCCCHCSCYVCCCRCSCHSWFCPHHSCQFQCCPCNVCGEDYERF